MDESKRLETLKDKMRGQNPRDILDYDFKVLALQFNRMINDYNIAVYQQDETFNFESICSFAFAEKTRKKILADKKYYRNRKVSIICKDIKCVNETFETIRYISDMDISYHIKIVYERVNTMSGEVVKNFKEYDEIVSLKNFEEGWKLSKIKNQYNLDHDVETISI